MAVISDMSQPLGYAYRECIRGKKKPIETLEGQMDAKDLIAVFDIRKQWFHLGKE